MGKKPENLIFRIIKDTTITNAHDFRVLVVLADCVSAKYGYAFPSLTTLAKRSAISRRAAVAAIARLEDAGRITVDRSGRSNRYRIVVKAISAKVVQESNQCSKVTSAGDALVQESNQNGAADAPVLVQEMHPINLNNKPRDKPTTPLKPPQGGTADLFGDEVEAGHEVGAADAEKGAGRDLDESAVSDRERGADNNHPPAKKTTAVQTQAPQAADAAPRQGVNGTKAEQVPLPEQMRLIWQETVSKPAIGWRVVSAMQEKTAKAALAEIAKYPQWQNNPLEGWRDTLKAMQRDRHLMGDNSAGKIYARPSTILKKDQTTLLRCIEAAAEGEQENETRRYNPTSISDRQAARDAIFAGRSAEMGAGYPDAREYPAATQHVAGSRDDPRDTIDLDSGDFRRLDERD